MNWKKRGGKVLCWDSSNLVNKTKYIELGVNVLMCFKVKYVNTSFGFMIFLSTMF